jgi:hypothetical protein
VAADGGVGADLEVGPAEFVLDLLVALLDPVADAVDPRDLGQSGGRVRAVCLAGTAGPGQVGDQALGGRDLDGFHARHAAQAADGLLDKSPRASDSADAAALALAVAGMGRAVLSLAIGISRLAETAEHFTGGPAPAPE